MLLFVQICTTGTAFTWALESINLRKDINKGKVRKKAAYWRAGGWGGGGMRKAPPSAYWIGRVVNSCWQKWIYFAFEGL